MYVHASLKANTHILIKIYDKNKIHIQTRTLSERCERITLCICSPPISSVEILTLSEDSFTGLFLASGCPELPSNPVYVLSLPLSLCVLTSELPGSHTGNSVGPL